MTSAKDNPTSLELLTPKNTPINASVYTNGNNCDFVVVETMDPKTDLTKLWGAKCQVANEVQQAVQ